MIKKILFGLTIAVGVYVGVATSSISAATSNIIVTPPDMATSFADVLSDPSKWFFYNDEIDVIDDSLGLFVTGPTTPPEGTDSVQISVIGSERRNLATYQFSGVKLADITDLKFSTYNSSLGNGGSANRSGYLNFNVDFNDSDTWQKRLAYVPSKNGTVVQDSWQEWDAIDGGNALWWWSGFANNGNKWPDGNTTEYRTWSDLLSSFADISIRTTDSWLGIRVGEPYTDGYTENIDKFVFGTSNEVKVFNFEIEGPPNPYAIPEECKDIPNLGEPIIGTNGSDSIKGTDGNDLIFGRGGSDSIKGGKGHDCIVGGNGDDSLKGQDGNDVILGGNGSDSIKGGNGKDSLYGEAGSDSLKGDNGNDYIDGGTGSWSDAIKGGKNTDTCVNAASIKQCEL